MASQQRWIKQWSDGPVCVLELNRPEVMNAISADLESALRQQLLLADQDESVRAVVLTGAGRAFSSGFDMNKGRPKPASRAEVLDKWWSKSASESDALLRIMDMQTPVIAAVNGWALGGGFWYSLACDITIAAESAVFGQPEVRQVSSTSVLFAALAGWKHAHRYALTGDHFDAQEALRIGIVNEVVPDEDLLDHALALGHRLAKVPRASIRINKAVTSLGLQMQGLRDAVAVNSLLSAMAHASNDAPDTAHLQAAKESGDIRMFARMRDEPFLPEPGGPRSKGAKES